MSQLMQSRFLRPMGYFLPVLGAIGAIAFVVPKYLALRADEDTLKEVQKESQLRAAALDALRVHEPTTVVARVTASRDEPVEFLRNLNAVAAQYGVRLTRLIEAPAQPDPAASASPDGTPAAGAAWKLPEGTRQVTLDVMAEGEYRRIAVFFARLESYPRLISLSRVTMKAQNAQNPPYLTVQFHLSRYVETAAPPQANSSGNGSSPLSSVASGERAGQDLKQAGQP